MIRLDTLSYLKLNKWQRLIYNLKLFFCGIPKWFLRLFTQIWLAIKTIGLKIADIFKDIGTTFVRGSWKTKVSYFIMGFGSIMYGQWLRGILFLVFEALFIFYMCFAGAHWLSKFPTLGTELAHTEEVYVPALDDYYETTVAGDSSFKILLYGLLTIFFIIALIYTWYLNVKQCRICEEIIASGKKVKTAKQDMKSMLDDQFHKTLLALPLTGILVFTVMPIIFMILVAFTNYDATHPGNGYANLFTWVGLDNFNLLLDFGSGGGYAFGEILAWTLMWAFFATFTNYFLGMFVAMMINKKGIRLKKVWRTVLVLTIAIPQFISLLYVSNLFADNGVVNGTLMNLGIISKPIKFWGETGGNPWLPRLMVILVNIWVGIPYLMLISTGILMNIPQDLYEQSRIDGANAWQQYTKITLPYMLFVTGPYLLTSFVGNINNFNVIFLLTGGGPDNAKLIVDGTLAGDTDLLITWLYDLTTGASANYKLASVIGILIFLVVALISLVVYNVMPSNRNEGDFS